MVALAFLSLSRTGFAVALFVCVIALVGFDTPRKLGRTVAILGVVTVLGTAAVIYTNPFAARFSEPDRVTLPGGVKVSVSGREEDLESDLELRALFSARGPRGGICRVGRMPPYLPLPDIRTTTICGFFTISD